jgi:putative spermidine/putrescine transport system ATP-binding protein
MATARAAESRDAYLVLQDLTKRYGEGAPAVAGVRLAIERGAFVTFLGPSGCGKTTLLRMIAGLVPPTGGRIRLAGADVTDEPVHRRNMGLVFQNYALFPHLSVARNIAFGLEMRGVRAAESRQRVDAALKLTHLEGLGERHPKQLSGGQQQRVALARALVIEPAVLLLDEPLSNLDAKLREELRDEIRDIQRRLGITAIFVTHDQAEALTLSDQVVVMNAGQIEQVGTPREVYETPATPFVATFIGRTNRVEALVEASGPDGAVLSAGPLRFRSASTLPAGARAVAMIRPHRIRVVGQGTSLSQGVNAVEARIRRVTFAGELVEYEVEAGPMAFVVEQPTLPGAGREAAAGDVVRLEWAPADTLVFPP